MKMSNATNIKSKIEPLEIEAGAIIDITCDFSGTLHYGFFDVALLDNERKTIVWMPDRNTWNGYRDTGILSGTKKFSTRWKHSTPDWLPKGEYNIQVLVYDDESGKNLGRPTPVAIEEHKILVNDSKHPEAIFVRKMYKLLLERIPDLPGYRTWFTNLQIVKASRRQILETGFLRSPEFRVKLIHKLIKNENIKNTELEASIQYLRHAPLHDLISKEYSSEIGSKEEFKNQIVEYLKLDEKGIEELEGIEKKSTNVEEFLALLIDNFLLEKYILIRSLYPDLSKQENQKKVQLYLTNPDEIIKNI